MNLRLSTAAAAALALAALACSGCSARGAAGGRPAEICFGYNVTTEEIDREFQYLRPLADYLERTLKVRVTLRKSDGYGPMVEAMRARKVNVASVGALTYIIASEKAGMEMLAVRGFPDGSLGSYHSIIAVPSSSPIRSLKDLKDNAGNLDFSFTDVASTSGHLYPRQGLEQAGIDAERDFKSVMFSPNHVATALALKGGKVDAVAMSELITIRLLRSGKLRKEDYRVLWRSGPIVSSVLTVQKDYPEAFKTELRAAFTNLHRAAPALWERMKRAYAVEYGVSDFAYVAATDDVLAEMRALVRKTKHLKLEAN